MNQDYIKPNNWSIIEEGFDKNSVKSSESLFSIGNGAMGQRANFEEKYTGKTFQGSYIAGIYYPDKTKVGWWKNGYPEYFAKVLNAPNWIGIDIEINGEKFKQLYGMSSETAMNKHVGGVAEYRASEGKTVEIPYRGAVENTVQDFLGGLRSTCTYVGASRLKELTKRTTFIRVQEQHNEVFSK